MKRRTFVTLSLAAGGALALGGGAAYVFTKDSDPLDDHYQGTRKALAEKWGPAEADRLLEKIKRENLALAREMPDIGGRENIFTEWLVFGVYYLAVYRVLQTKGQSVDQVGRVIFRTFQAMADYPGWVLWLVGRLKYGDRYLGRLKQAAAQSQKRRYPGDWVAAFVEGDGKTFDYGLDITECGICKFYQAQGAPELAPYLCLSDYVVSQAFGRGLVRHKTLAEGDGVCDFRFRPGRETYVRPLRDGWPPRFGSGA